MSGTVAPEPDPPDEVEQQKPHRHLPRQHPRLARRLPRAAEREKRDGKGVCGVKVRAAGSPERGDAREEGKLYKLSLLCTHQCLIKWHASMSI